MAYSSLRSIEGPSKSRKPKKARRTPTEIGQTTPSTPTGEKRKAAAVRATSKSGKKVRRATAKYQRQLEAEQEVAAVRGLTRALRKQRKLATHPRFAERAAERLEKRILKESIKPMTTGSVVAREARKTAGQGIVGRTVPKLGIADKKTARKVANVGREIALGSRDPDVADLIIAAAPIPAVKGAKLARSAVTARTAGKAAKATKAAKAGRTARKAERKAARAKAGTGTAKARATAKGMSKGAKARLSKVERKAIKARAVHRTARSATSPVGAAALAAPGDVGERARALAEGTVTADPLQTAKTTGRAIPATLAFGATLAGDAATAATTGDTGPLKGTLKQGENAIKSLEPLVSGDPEKVREAMEEEIGYWFAPLVPRGALSPAGKALKAGAKKVKIKPRIPEGAGRPGKLRTAKQIGAGGKTRKRIATQFARESQRARYEAARAARDVEKPARKIKKSRSFRNLHGVESGDAVSVLARYGISRKNPKAQLERVVKSLDPKDAGEIVNVRKVADFLRKNPEVLADKNLWRSVDAAKKRLGQVETSSRAKYLAQGRVLGVRFPEDRVPVPARRITAAETRAGAVGDVKARRTEASRSRRKAKTIVRPAERKLESAKRRRLRAEASEAEARGGARVRVSQRDRKILRNQEDYTESVKELNAASKAATAARKNFGNAARYESGRLGDKVIREHLDSIERRASKLSDDSYVERNGLLEEASALRAGVHPAKAAERRLVVVQTAVREARKRVNEVRADVYSRAEIAASKLARGEKADALLASLHRGPVGTLRTLERKGSRVAELTRAEQVAREGVAKARVDQRLLRAEAKMLDKSASDLQRIVSRYTKGDIPPSRLQQRKKWDAELVKEFTDEVRKAAKKEGFEEPAWMAERRLPTEGDIGGPKLPASATRATHVKTGKAEATDVADRSLRNLVASSVYAPRMQRALHRVVTRFATQESIPVMGNRKVVTGEEYARLVAGKKIDPREHVLLPSRQWKTALEGEEFASGFFDIDGLHADVVGRLRKDLHQLDDAPGTKYVVVRREAAREFADQVNPQGNGLETFLNTTGMAGTRIILGLSPAWMIAQVAAEGLQAIAAQSNPVRVAKSIRALRQLRKNDPEGYEAFAGVAGESSASFDPPSSTRVEMDGRTQGRFADAGRAMRKTPVGRLLMSAKNVELLGLFDRWKGGKYRSVITAARADRELNGFFRGLRGTLRHQDKIARKLKGRPLHEQLSWLSRNPKALEKHLDYLDDVMGNWNAFTRFERQFAPALVFYPFVRMSMRWTFWSYPKRHPVKAQLLYLLAQQNAEELEKVLGVKPNFLQLAQPVLHGEDGEVSGVLPGGPRFAAPGSNVLTQAIGEENISGVARALNPLLGTAYTAVSGDDPFTGEDADIGRGFLALNQFLSMAAPVRALGLNRFGKEDSPVTEEFRELDPVKSFRSLVNPFEGQSAEAAREQAKLSQTLERAGQFDSEVGQFIKLAEEQGIDEAVRIVKQDQRASDRLRKKLGQSDDPEIQKIIEKFYEVKYSDSKSSGSSSSGGGGAFDDVFGGGSSGSSGSSSGGGGAFQQVFGN